MIELHREYHSASIRYSLCDDNKEIGRAYLYFISNSLHKNPYGLLEDLYVEPSYRGNSYGTFIIQEVIRDCKYNRCYKLIANSRESREKVHILYKNNGLVKYGYEFRLDF